MLKKILGVLRMVKGRLHRFVSPVGFARSLGVTVGENCRLIGVNFGTEPYLVTLGDHVSATHTMFITHDGGVWVFRDRSPEADICAPIRVGSNVFIGEGVIVLPGVTIGDNVVIGAGAVVARDIPSNCVAAGVPARPLKSLEHYWEGIQPRLLATKGLSPGEKRAFLIRHFSASRTTSSLP